MKQSHAIKNNNPGNILWGDHDEWRGLVLTSHRTDPDYCEFTHAKYGIRAMALVLLKQSRKHNLKTVEQIVSKWAQNACELTSPAYTFYVAHQNAWTIDQELNLKDVETLMGLVRAIISVENGSCPYAESLLKQGVLLALGY